MKKVQFQCFLWGLGTAIGELPPYYIARRVRVRAAAAAAVPAAASAAAAAALRVPRLVGVPTRGLRRTRQARLAGQMVEELEEVEAMESNTGAVPLMERAKISGCRRGLAAAAMQARHTCVRVRVCVRSCVRGREEVRFCGRCR